MIKKYFVLTKKQKIIVCVIGIFIFLMHHFHVLSYINTTYLYEHMHLFQDFVRDFYIMAVGAYMGCYMLATIFSIPGSSVFNIAGGLLFGVWPGVLYALVAATCGATALFLMSRYVIGSWVQQRYADNLNDFNQELALHGHYYLLVVRLIALLPFCVVNILSGLTLLSVKTYAWVTFVGLIPVVVMYAYAGRQLGQLQSADDFYSRATMVVGLVVVFKVIFVPVFVKMYKRFRVTLSE